MKQVIGILVSPIPSGKWDDVTVRELGAGGSETWAVEMASAFVRRGFHVVLFCDCFSWHFSSDGVEYVPVELFMMRCEYQHFDYFIESRSTIGIGPHISCDNVYVIAHDMTLASVDAGGYKLDKVKKIAYLSEWQKNFIINYGGIPITPDRMFKTSNPVVMNNYLDRGEYHKKNQMLWSSTLYRNFKYFVENIFPEVKKMVPDFEVVVASYENGGPMPQVDGIRYVGKLNKKQLAEYQKESKVWVYPNIGFYDTGTGTGAFQETFCITAIENAFAGNALLCYNIGGLPNVIDGYSGILGKEFGDKYDGAIFLGDPTDQEVLKKQMISETIRLLTDEDYRRKMADEAFEICKKYTPEEAVDTWLREWRIKY